MAVIRRRKGPRGVRWQAVIRLANTRPVRRTFDSKAKAVTFARDEEARLQKARELAGSHTLADAIARYVRSVVRDKSPTTQRSDKRLLGWWLKRHGEKPLSAITRDLIALERDGIREKSSGPTANRYLAAISSVLRRAYREWGWIGENPASRVDRFAESLGRVRWLEAAEIDRLLIACAKSHRPELRTIVALGLATGMRQGEILGLRWTDVDMQRRLITLHRTKNRERRGIPIAPQLIAELRALPRRLDSPFLFPALRPDSRERWPTYRKAWQRAVAEAALVDFRFHDLRHTAASYLAMGGATEREIAEVLGHKTLQMVKRYSHLSREHLTGVLESLATQVLPPAKGHQSS